MDYLSQLREIYPQITDLGADAVAIASKPAMMAQTVLDSGFPFALLMDPDYTARTALELKRTSLAFLLKPQGLKNYAKSLGSLKQFRLELDDATNRPAALILDSEQNVAWTHIGKSLGDYPATDTLLAELANVS